MFSLPTTVTVSGTEYLVRTDFRVILEIFVMLEDPNLSDSDKTEALLWMFYEDRPPAEDTDAAIFNFDGKLSQEEFLNGLKALLPVAGGILGRETPDGDFGPATEKAVRSFQAEAALDSDGEIGADTLGRLLTG